MNQATDVTYNQHLDILTIDRSDGEYDCSIQQGDIIIDLTPEGAVRGVEIQNISALLDIDQEVLDTATEATISTDTTADQTTLTIRITTDTSTNALITQIPADQLTA